MSVHLSHRQALEQARDAGALLRAAFGPLDAVVGIRRSGTPVARAFALGADHPETLFVTKQRSVSQGRTARWRTLVRQVTPRSVRMSYKKLFFKQAVRLTRWSQRGTTPSLRDDQLDRLRSALGRETAQCIVVVDDAIDTGQTATAVVDAVQQAAPGARVLMFALTSTVGARVIPDQVHLFDEVVEFLEGDLADLNESSVDTLLGALSSQQPATPLTTLKVRADELVPDLLTRAQSCLGSLGVAAWIRTHVGPRTDAAESLNAHIQSLEPPARDHFGKALRDSLGECAHTSRLVLARAPHVDCHIVADPLPSCAKELEAVFGLPFHAGHITTLEKPPAGGLLSWWRARAITQPAPSRNDAPHPSR